MRINKKDMDKTNRLIVKRMSYRQYISYAIYAAEQLIDIFEESYIDNTTPRKMIEVAKKSLKKCLEDKVVTADHAVAYAVAYAINALARRDTSISSDYAAAYTAGYAKSHAAGYYAIYAVVSDVVLSKKIRTKILNYGISLLMEKK